MSPNIVVVTSDDHRRAALLETLTDAGYIARGAATFAEARYLLKTRRPDLVIADERLGPFNGLHVAVVGRSFHPRMKAIVTTHTKDEGLEQDARRLNVQCVVEPSSASDWLTSVSESLLVLH